MQVKKNPSGSCPPLLASRPAPYSFPARQEALQSLDRLAHGLGTGPRRESFLAIVEAHLEQTVLGEDRSRRGLTHCAPRPFPVSQVLVDGGELTRHRRVAS